MFGKHLFKKTAAFMVMLAILIQFSPYIAFASAKEVRLEDKLTTAAILLQDVMQQQYKNTVGEIKDLINKNGYDYSYTMESFMDMGNPFRDMDYIKFIATYAAVNHKLKEDGRSTTSILDTRFLEWDYETESFEEYKPYKIDEYEETEDGLYKKTGYRFSDRPETIGVYKETDKPGLFEKTGEETTDPERKTTTFAIISLKTLTPEEYIANEGYDTEDLIEDIERRENILLQKENNETLKSNIFINLPESVLTQNEWNELFMQALGYNGETDVSINGTSIVNIAATLVGQVPYEWGGKASSGGFDPTWWTYNESDGRQKGLDCSGFVQWVYMTAGFDKEITDKMISTGTMLGSDMKRVTEAELQPGDIGVVQHTRSNHCGIYAGDGQWFHCTSLGGSVVKADYHFTTFFRPIEEGMNLERHIKGYKDGEQVFGKTDEEIEAIKEAEEAERIEKERQEEERAQKQKEEQEKRKEKEEIKPKEEETPKPEQPAETPVQEPIEIPIIETPDPIEHTDDDVMLLAQLIHHEANNQGLNGWIGVGEVVRNRVESPLFPNSVKEVINQPGQFTNASNIASIKPRAEIINVANSILNGGYGILNNKNVLYFRNPNGNTTGYWGKHAPYMTINQHTFYLQ